ncbi:hypothetical protein CNEO_60100 [Clostridium neonatale]|uniref:Uncharacterized protein n=1 Tax=Clostridium neonatale TaxID=137838 RepID=A0AA86JKK4_9CLOT|nr:hypothetical protein CNEO_60100 [Clostridium neonatale]
MWRYICLKKYYAIKRVMEYEQDSRTWEECKVLVLGYPAIYKSFKLR